MRRLAWLLLALPLPLSAATWEMVADGSWLRFSTVGQGEAFQGRFEVFEADIRFDPRQPQQCRFEVRVQLSSADTDNEERDQTLTAAPFFRVGRHPVARYRAERCHSADDGFVAEGRLELNGIEHAVPLAFGWRPSDGGAVLEGRATLDRMRFDVGTGDWADASMIAHEVEVATRVTLKPCDG